MTMPTRSRFVNDRFIISELRGLRMPDGTALWPPDAGLSIRSATESENTMWEDNLVEDLADGVHESREDAVESNGFAFLVDYRDPHE